MLAKSGVEGLFLVTKVFTKQGFNLLQVTRCKWLSRVLRLLVKVRTVYRRRLLGPLDLRKDINPSQLSNL